MGERSHKKSSHKKSSSRAPNFRENFTVIRDSSFDPSNPSSRDVMSRLTSGVIDSSGEGVLGRKLDDLASEMSKLLSSLNVMQETLRRSLEQDKPAVQSSLQCFPLLLDEDSKIQNGQPHAPDPKQRASAENSGISTGRRADATETFHLLAGDKDDI